MTTVYENTRYKIEVKKVEEIGREAYVIINKEFGVDEQAVTELPQALYYADWLELQLVEATWREGIEKEKERLSPIAKPAIASAH